MKTNIVIFILLLCISHAFAKPNFYVGTGISNPYGPEDFQRYWHSGYSLFGGVGWQFNNFELAPILAYDNLSIDDVSYLEQYENSESDFAYSSVTGGSTTLTTISVDAKYYSPAESVPNFLPYLFATAGLGIKNIAEKEVFLADDLFKEKKITDAVPMLGAGIGVEVIAGGHTNVSIQVQGNALFTDEITFYIPIRVGISIK